MQDARKYPAEQSDTFVLFFPATICYHNRVNSEGGRKTQMETG